MNRARDGVALVLVVSLLALLLALAAAWRQTESIVAAFGRTGLSGVRAGLAAESGLAYAAARLVQNPHPAHDNTLQTRGDTWVPREPPGALPQALQNPSYAHGEPWIDSVDPGADGLDNDRDGLVDAEDAAEGEGLFTPGEAYADSSGDGVFTACSGRLRGAPTSWDNRFLLAIDVLDGRIPVNGGSLKPGEANDDTIPYHRGLIHALNNLGVVRGLQYRRWNVGPLISGNSPENCIKASWLGYDILRNRPPGGYETAGRVRSTLLQAGYSPADCDAVIPFLDLGSCDGLCETSRFRGVDEGLEHPSYAPVNLWGASRPVLESLWMYLATKKLSVFGNRGSYTTPSPFLYTSRARPETVNFMGFNMDIICIFHDEARRIAARLARLRLDGALDWPAWHAELASRAEELFPADHADLAGYPEFRFLWMQSKADLAFHAVALDPYPFKPGMDGLKTWASGGIDRDPDIPGCQETSAFPLHLDIFRMKYPTAPPPYPGSEWATSKSPYQSTDGSCHIGAFFPLGGTLAPPARFEVGSIGVAGGRGNPERRSVTGSLRVLECLEFASQEDFEDVSEGAVLRARGIGARRETEAWLEERFDRREDRIPQADGGVESRFYPHVVTLPRTNRRSMTAACEADPYYGFSRVYGAVTLASRQSGSQSASLYWPFKADFDLKPDNDGGAGPVWTAGEHGDYWHEKGTGYAGPFPGDPFRFFTDGSPGEYLDTAENTPFQATTLNLDLPQCPGMTSPPGTPIESFVIECWLPVSGSVELKSLNGQSLYLDLTLSLQRAGGILENDVSLDLDVSGNKRSWLFDAVPGKVCHVLVIARMTEHMGDPKQDFTVFLNGILVTGSSSTLLKDGDREMVYTMKADELRLHDRSPSDPQAYAVHVFRLDRFVRRGTFTSPLYTPDTPVLFGECAWTGLVPDGMRNDDGDPLLWVEVIGFSGPDGSGVQSSVASGLPGGRVDLAALGAVRSFLYKVHFDCETVPQVLVDVPLFESIWFSFRRPGRAPRWLDFTAE